MKPLVHVRFACESDIPLLQCLFAEDPMAEPERADLLQGMVAVNENDEPVGFIRILTVCDTDNPAGNGNYVYPVIVFRNWQGHGVGRMLIDHAHIMYGQLKLVACRASRDFYPKCGFEPLDWSEVAGVIARDCERCADLSTCDPQAFILRS